MAEPFVDSETDRTKSRWVAEALRDFGRPRTTVRSLFYFAMKRGISDYPICGKLVGEIRICRPYDESDGERLSKWVGRARKLGFIPEGAILDEIPGERVIVPETSSDQSAKLKIEVWMNKSSLIQLILPICAKHGATLVSIERPSCDAVEGLCRRADRPTAIFCLSDLSTTSFSFCRDLEKMIAEANCAKGKDIKVIQVGLSPKQVIDLKLPMVRGDRGGRKDRKDYGTFLKPHGLSEKKMAELDAIDVYYQGGLAKFLDDAILSYIEGHA